MTLTIKLDRNWSSFQQANSAPPLSVTDSAIAPSARIQLFGVPVRPKQIDLRASLVLGCNTSTHVLEALTQCLAKQATTSDILHVRQACMFQNTNETVTPKGVLPPALCHASATPESA